MAQRGVVYSVGIIIPGRGVEKWNASTYASIHDPETFIEHPESFQMHPNIIMAKYDRRNAVCTAVPILFAIVLECFGNVLECFV